MVPLSGSDVSAQDIEQLLRTLGASPVYAGFTPAVTALQYVLADQYPYNDCSHLGEEPIFIPDCCWISHDRKTICRRLFSQPFHFSDVSSGQRLAGLSAIKKCYRKT